MTERRRNLAQYRPTGLQLDPTPAQVPPDRWTNGRNVRVLDGTMQAAPGWLERYTQPVGFTPLWHLAGQYDGRAYWWAHGAEDSGTNASILVQDGSAAPPGSPAGVLDWAEVPVLAPDTSIGLLSGALLDSAPIFNVKGHRPAFWDYNATAVQEIDTTAAGLNQTGAVVWTFQDHIFLGDLVQGGELRPDAIAWSDAAEPGWFLPGNAGAPSFDPDPSREAGGVELADTRGAVVQGLQIRQACAVYKERGIYLLDYLGRGPFWFRSRQFSSQAGLLCRHGVAEKGGRHYLISDNEFLAHDAQSLGEISSPWVRREWFGRLNGAASLRAFVAVNPIENEIWFCGALDGANFPNHAAILDLESGDWGFAEIGDQLTVNSGWRYARPGIIDVDAATGETWADANYTWDSAQAQRPWRVSQLSGQRDSFMALDAADGSVGGKTFYVEVGISDTRRQEEQIPVELRRESLDLEAPDTIKLVRSIHLHGPTQGEVSVAVGTQYTEADPITWQPFATVDLATRQQIPCLASGRLISVWIKGIAPLEVRGFAVEGTEVGQF